MTSGRSSNTPLLKVRGLTKSFPGVLALDDLSLDVHEREIVAVVGQNGSGKSTLVKILAGLYDHDGGTVEVLGADGRVVAGREALGELHFIHQDLGLVNTLSTIENLDLGREVRSIAALRPIRPKDEFRRAHELISRFGPAFNVAAPVGSLSTAERSMVAIARAMSEWTSPANVLVLDEPTAALEDSEARRLRDAVKRVAADGAGVIFVSHRLDEVVELADRVVVLRDGKVVAELDRGNFDQNTIVRHIVGSELAHVENVGGASDGEIVLEVDDLAGRGVVSVDLRVRRGEIVGIAGLLGSGQEDLCSVIYGSESRYSGSVRVAGQVVKPDRPDESKSKGMAIVPADRRGGGLVMDHPVRENLTLPMLAPLVRSSRSVDRRAEQREAAAWFDRVELRPATPERPAKLFSGGNQQKVVLAKCLRTSPAVLLLQEPTQGVDVGAKASIYAIVSRAAREGAAVVVSSTDPTDLTALCDRVLVMRDGRVVSEITRADLSDAAIVRAVHGSPEGRWAVDVRS